MREHGADLAEGLYQIWDTRKWFVSSEGHRIDQHIRECGAGITATAIGEDEIQRRSCPSHRGQYGTRGWELVEELDLAAQRRPDRRGGARAAHRAGVPVRRHRPDPRRRAARAADPRVGRARHRARPDPRLGGGVRRHVLARPRPARLAALRLRADEHHHRPDDPRRAGQLRLRRRGHAGRQARRGPRRHLGRCAGRAGLGRRRRARLRRQRARRRLVPAADGADDQRRARARPAHARRDHRRHRRRGVHGDQPVLVDRRPAAELPVRLRDRLRGQERHAAGGCCATRRTPASARSSGSRWTCSPPRPSPGARPNCGKGQPGQIGHTGHPAAPARFRDVRVGVRG